MACPKEAHTKAAEHHETAAKSHRTAAEHHGKGDHAKGQESQTKAQSHSKTAREHSDTAHGKSQRRNKAHRERNRRDRRSRRSIHNFRGRMTDILRRQIFRTMSTRLSVRLRNCIPSTAAGRPARNAPLTARWRDGAALVYRSRGLWSSLPGSPAIDRQLSWRRSRSIRLLFPGLRSRRPCFRCSS